MTARILIEYDPRRLVGRFIREASSEDSPIWERLSARFAGEPNVGVSADYIEVSWPEVLGVVRDFGSRATQKSLDFRFAPGDEAKELIARYVEEVRSVRATQGQLRFEISHEEIEEQLRSLGFTERVLRDFQLDDLQHLLSLPHGANFSVPGAGKTTVTFALHLLAAQDGEHLFIVCPKAAFPAWRGIVDECIGENAPGQAKEQFTFLDGDEAENEKLLQSGATRFVMSYDLLIRQQNAIAAYFSRQKVHLVLDESHRMKAGMGSLRGAFLLSISGLPVRKDILSGTPMPQDANDLASQLEFLWPKQGLDRRLSSGDRPRDVLGNLYVRTTKSELGLPPADRHIYQVRMADGQKALYSLVQSETLRQLTAGIRSPYSPDFMRAKRSVMRLLQLSSNPTLALQGMATSGQEISSGIADQVIREGASTKMRAVADHARELAHSGKKSVIWTIFTQNIFDLETMLADLNPVSIYGGVLSGDPSDPTTREGILHRFHQDPACSVLIANPAAAGEGISLHHVCHDAIYLDRSYVSTHFLQSIDRIHRLGLPPDAETNIHIYQTKAPRGMGSIDLSVSRRLLKKIDNLQELLGDPDLKKLVLDEEEADDPVDLDVDLEDLVDLVAELEGGSIGGGEDG